MKTWAVLGVWLALLLPARAHRLDEYLQATRLALARDRIELHVDLTPGVAIVPQLLPWIDPDGNGRITRSERNTYAQRVLRDLHLELDGRQLPLRMRRATFSSRADLVTGEGVIQLTVQVKGTRLGDGPHQLFFRNDHLPAISVYQVNALQPQDHLIRITQQARDKMQHEYRLDFVVESPPR